MLETLRLTQMLLPQKAMQPQLQLKNQPLLNLLLKLREEIGQTLIMVTHDLSIAEHADRIFMMDNGVLTLHRDYLKRGKKTMDY